MNPEELDQTLEQLYQSARSASSEGLMDEALAKCDEALTLLESFGEDTERHSYSGFLMLQGDVYWGAAMYEEAFLSFNRVAMYDPERYDARASTGISLYHICRFHAAQTFLEICSVEQPDDAEVWYYLGLLAMRNEQKDLSHVYFKTAHELDEEKYFIPTELSEDELIKMIARLFDDFPEELSANFEDFHVEIEMRPPDNLLFSADPVLDPTMPLVVLTDTELTEDDQNKGKGPFKIVLFRENLSLHGHDRQTLEEEVWITLKEEVARVLDIDEEDMERLGID